MKRILIVSTFLFAVLITVSACSKEPATDGAQKGSQNAGQPGPGERGQRMPDFGQPDRVPDVRGVVKSIVGNEATILKIDMKAGRGQNASSTPANGDASNTRQAPAISLSGNTRNGAGGGARAWTGGAGGPGGPGGSGTTDRAAMLERMKAMSTGEETITIPVGIQMLKSSSDTAAKQRTMVEATLSDITSDKSVTIWLASSTTDKKIAEFVLIN
jgi:hypothetical protein